MNVFESLAKAIDLYTHGTWGDRITISRNQAAELLRATFHDLQRRTAEWMVKQPWAPDQQPWELLLGVQEEVGELARAHLKQHQKIRGSSEMWEQKGKDAVGDIFVFLAGYCAARGWSLQECIEMATDEVFKRDWTKFPMNGRTE